MLVYGTIHDVVDVIIPCEQVHDVVVGGGDELDER